MLIVLTGTIAMLALVLFTTKFTIRGSFEGLYLLKGPQGSVFELSDDIVLGEYDRVLLKVEFGALFTSSGDVAHPDTADQQLKYKWHDRSGSGYLMNHFPDGTKFLLAFGRFLDSQGKIPEGIFVGGGIPVAAYEHEIVIPSETGMAYYNGEKWLHLWCNANESISSAFSPERPVFPSQWKFLGSKVLYDHAGELLLKSSHELRLDDAPIRMDRFAYYRAGDRFFTLIIRITNIGKSPVGYFYVYGDEPWVGHFGSSAGNIGWSKNRLYYYESSVDLNNNSFAGMFDNGNPVLKNMQYVLYTGTANFIEWLGNVRPDLVYFSNRIGGFSEESGKIPLESNNNRIIMLQWGPRMLAPGASESIILAMGMAVKDPSTGIPVKPPLQLDKDSISYIIKYSDK